MFAGFLSDRFGRKKMLFLCALLYAVSGILSALPRTFEQFLAARFLSGLGIGASSMICPVYIAEIAPEKSRGRLGTLFQLGIVTGIFLTLFINKVVQGLGDEAWNTTLRLAVDARDWRPSRPSSSSGCCSPCPRARAGWPSGDERTRRRSILEKVDGPEHAARSWTRSGPRCQAGGGPVLGALHGVYRRPLVIAVLLMASSQFCGINAIIYYSTRIFARRGR